MTGLSDGPAGLLLLLMILYPFEGAGGATGTVPHRYTSSVQQVSFFVGALVDVSSGAS